MLGQFRVLRQPLAPARDESGDRLADRDEGFVQRAIGGQFEIAPIRNRRVDPPVDHRKDFLQMLLDHVALLLERVHVVTKREVRGDIHGVTHQILLNVHRRPFVRRALPAIPETLGDFDERGEKLA